MDPLTILSLAGNIIQFVSFGAQLVSQTKEIYKSTTGTLDTNAELGLATSDLQAIITRFRQYVHICDFPRPPAAQENTCFKCHFQEICNDAGKVAESLLDRLQKLKVKGEHKAWKSFKQAIKTAWSVEEIDALKKRLEGFRSALGTHVLVNLSEKLDRQSLSQSTRFDSLDAQNKIIVSALSDNYGNHTRSTASVLKDQMAALAQLAARLETITAEAGDMIKAFKATAAEEATNRRQVQGEILKALQYSTMTNRYEQVSPAYQCTFDWIFHPSKTDKVPWSNFVEWLERGEDVYWINGKAGSGKSTLMKHIYTKPSTQKLLRSWAGDTPLCSSTFFFWNSGPPEQKSLLGLLRAIMYDIFHQCPSLIPVVFPLDWAQAYSHVLRSGSVPAKSFNSKEVLMKAFETIGLQTALPVKICLFVDGLDEYDGDHEELAEAFKRVSKFANVRVCCSSRPWVVFQELFQECSRLRLQDLTYGDIRYYVSHKMHNNSAFKRMFEKDSSSATELIEEVVQKADGVFLWVEIVVRSLINGIRHRDEPMDLRKRLRLLPQELEPLYKHLISLIEPLHLAWASRTFQLVRSARENLEHLVTAGEPPNPLNLLGLYLALDDNIEIQNIPDYYSEGLLTICDDTRVRLTARCAGLLEVWVHNDQNPSTEMFMQEIKYLHRTARDFIERQDIWDYFLSFTAETYFNPTASLLTSSVRLLAIRSNYISSAKEMNDFWDTLAPALLYAHHANFQTNEARVTIHDQLGAFLRNALGRSASVESRWIKRHHLHLHRAAFEISSREEGTDARSGTDSEGDVHSEKGDGEDSNTSGSIEIQPRGSTIQQAEPGEEANGDPVNGEETENPYIMDRYSPLPWAVIYDLTAYVSAKIQTADQPPSLLHYLITVPECLDSITSDESLLPGDNPLLHPTPSAKMASILVRNGGDPNKNYFGRPSAWETMLLCISRFRPGDQSTVQQRRDYVGVILVLVRGGADLHATVMCDGYRISAMEILQTAYFREYPREFPKESHELFCEINGTRRGIGANVDHYHPRKTEDEHGGPSRKRFKFTYR